MGIRPVREAALAAVAGAGQAALLAAVRRKQVVGLTTHAIGASWRATDPQVMRRFLIHAGKAFLILPVPWAFSPAPSATLCRLLLPECSHCQRCSNNTRMPGRSGSVRRRPHLSVSDHDGAIAFVMTASAQCTSPVPRDVGLTGAEEVLVRSECRDDRVGLAPVTSELGRFLTICDAAVIQPRHSS
jgi:hypothetical protein